MSGKRTYVLSIHDPEGHVLLEEVRSGRHARLADLSEIAAQIEHWADSEEAEAGAQPATGGPADSQV